MGDVCRCTKYALPGSQELADNCVKALGEKANSCLIHSHGAVCVGENMEGAFKVAKSVGSYIPNLLYDRSNRWKTSRNL